MAIVQLWEQTQLQGFSSQLLVRQQFQRRLQEWVGGKVQGKLHHVTSAEKHDHFVYAQVIAGFNTRSLGDHWTRRH